MGSRSAVVLQSSDPNPKPEQFFFLLKGRILVQSILSLNPKLWVTHTNSHTLGLIMMALILDGNSEHVPHALRKLCLFGEKNDL